MPSFTLAANGTLHARTNDGVDYLVQPVRSGNTAGSTATYALDGHGILIETVGNVSTLVAEGVKSYFVGTNNRVFYRDARGNVYTFSQNQPILLQP